MKGFDSCSMSTFILELKDRRQTSTISFIRRISKQHFISRIRLKIVIAKGLNNTIELQNNGSLAVSQTRARFPGHPSVFHFRNVPGNYHHSRLVPKMFLPGPLIFPGVRASPGFSGGPLSAHSSAAFLPPPLVERCPFPLPFQLYTPCFSFIY